MNPSPRSSRTMSNISSNPIPNTTPPLLAETASLRAPLGSVRLQANVRICRCVLDPAEMRHPMPLGRQAAASWNVGHAAISS